MGVSHFALDTPTPSHPILPHPSNPERAAGRPGGRTPPCCAGRTHERIYGAPALRLTDAAARTRSHALEEPPRENCSTFIKTLPFC